MLHLLFRVTRRFEVLFATCKISEPLTCRKIGYNRIVSDHVNSTEYDRIVLKFILIHYSNWDEAPNCCRSTPNRMSNTCARN